MKNNGSSDKKLASYTIPLILVGIVVIMIIPIPVALLDILLSLNITLALIILFVSLYLERPLEFSAYPALLLITTLFRLSLNISTTRIILLHGNEGRDAAGDVIKSFGDFVLGGNYVIGVVIFVIIMIINFMVITKGSGRIAEVAARFTLDAMPGKQIAIDSDLNSGLINEAEAKQRRQDLAREAEFYGAMDGASKFVRGDAVAGIVITFVNIIGGFFIGVIQSGMKLRQAAETYTLLTVGDGLASQIPALIISISAGLIVARAASGKDLGNEVSEQLTTNNRPLYLASAVSCLFAFVPGLPFLPFIILSILSFMMGNAVKKIPILQEQDRKDNKNKLPSPPIPGSTEDAKELLTVELLELEVGYELVPLVDTASGGDLIERIRAIRRQFALELGFIVPSIHIRDNIRLQPSQYRLLLKGSEIATGTIKTQHLLAMDPGTGGEITAKIPGIPTKEPAFGLDAIWINEADKERAQFAGYTVVDIGTVITTHITEIIKRHAHELLGRQETQELLDNLAKQTPKLVEEVVPGTLTLGCVQQVLSGLLREGVSIRDLRTILETIADHGTNIKIPDRLIELTRRELARSITSKLISDDGILTLTSLTPQLERVLNESLNVTDSGSYLALEPGAAQKLISKIKSASDRFAQKGLTPVVLAPASLRAALWSFCERFIPGVVVLSHNEVLPSTKVHSMGILGLDS